MNPNPLHGAAARFTLLAAGLALAAGPVPAMIADGKVKVLGLAVDTPLAKFPSTLTLPSATIAGTGPAKMVNIRSTWPPIRSPMAGAESR